MSKCPEGGDYWGYEYEARQKTYLKNVRANKLAEEGHKDEIRILDSLKKELKKEFGFCLWDKAMNSRLMDVEELYEFYLIERLKRQKFGKLINFFCIFKDMNLKYDPDNPLTDKQLDEIAAYDFDKFLEYLDSKTEYLKTKTRPLNTHELKKINFLDAASRGEEISDKRWDEIKKLGKENETINLG